MKRRLLAAILSLQAIAVGLTTPVLISINDVGTGTAVAIGLGLCAACILTAGLLRFEWAQWLGWAIQVASVAMGVLITVMYALGAVFLVLYATAWFMGAKIDREVAEREAAEAA